MCHSCSGGWWLVKVPGMEDHWLNRDCLSKWSWTQSSFGLSWIIVSLNLLRWEKHLAYRLVQILNYWKYRTVVNVQYPYWEMALAQIRKNSFKCNHGMVLPATFYNWNSMETGAFPPFPLYSVNGRVIPLFWQHRMTLHHNVSARAACHKMCHRLAQMLITFFFLLCTGTITRPWRETSHPVLGVSEGNEWDWFHSQSPSIYFINQWTN